MDVQSNSKSAVIAYCTGAKIRIGHGKGEAKEISAWLNNRLVDAEPAVPHIFMRNLRLLSILGMAETAPQFNLPHFPFCAQHVKQSLQALGIQRPFVLLVSFTGKAAKEWQPQHFTRLAERLSQSGIPVVFLHSPGRTNETQRLLPVPHNAPVVLSPLFTIQDMLELIRCAHAVVGGDTGPVHIAGALNIPTFSLFGPTDPKRSKPWGSTTVYLLDALPEQVANDIEAHWKQNRL